MSDLIDGKAKWLTVEQYLHAYEAAIIPAAKKLSDITTRFVYSEPYFGYIALNIKKETSPYVLTMGVGYSRSSGCIVMTYNPLFVLHHDEEHMKCFYKHELMHISLGHLSMINSIVSHDEFNVAADLAINSFFPKEFFSGFYHPLLCDLPPFLTTEKYIELIRNGKIPINSDSRKHIVIPTEQSSDWIPPDFTMPFVDHHSFNDTDQSAHEESKAAARHIAKDAYDRTVGFSDAARFGFGKASSNFKEPLENFIFSRSSIPWYEVLKKEVTWASEIEKQATRSKRHRRYGYAFPGVKTTVVLNVSVITDVSGSVNKKQYNDFINEIYNIKESVNCNLNIVQADANVISTDSIDRHSSVDINMLHRRGNGGTIFEPAIRFVEREYNPNIIIYLTDGFGSFDFVPSKIKTIWVVNNKVAVIPPSHGTSILMC